MSALLEMRNITKEYRGVPALKNVDFDLQLGEIHGLVGENGAGKSTLTKIMAGVTETTTGAMRLNGQHVLFKTPAEALRHGITMVFQETSLVPSMTVAQNLYLGDEKLFNRLRGIYIAAQTFLSSMNFSVDPWATVSTLGAAQKQMVEIARAVRQNARIIIFDEPTASLTPEEKYYFFSLMKKLKRCCVSIIFISHALEEALQNADRITVLRDGELVVTDVAVNFDRGKIIRAMVGRALSSELYSRKGGRRKTRRAGEKVLSVQNLSMGTIVRNNSFTIYSGQITGVFGLIGAGRSETAKIIAGIVRRDFFTAAKCGCSADRCVTECHDRRSGTALFTSLKIGSLKAFLKQCRSRKICRLAPYRPIRADASLCASRRCANWRTSRRKRSTSMHSTPTRES